MRLPPESFWTATPVPGHSGTPVPACSTVSSYGGSPRPASTSTGFPGRAGRLPSPTSTCDNSSSSRRARPSDEIEITGDGECGQRPHQGLKNPGDRGEGLTDRAGRIEIASVADSRWG